MIETSVNELVRLEQPLIQYSENRAYIELRTTTAELPEDETGCFLSLVVLPKTVSGPIVVAIPFLTPRSLVLSSRASACSIGPVDAQRLCRNLIIE
jgi:hypothetical protein